MDIVKGAVKAVKFHPLKEVLITGADKGRISLFHFCHEDLSMKKGDFFLQNVQFDEFLLDSMDFFDEDRSLLVHSANRVSPSICEEFLLSMQKTCLEVLLCVRSDGGQGVADIPTTGQADRN